MAPENVHLPALAARAARVPGEGAIETLARAQALEKQGRDIVHLEIGEPDFATPAHIVDAGVAAMRRGRTRYSAAPGTVELRAALAASAGALRGITLDPDHVLIGPGAKTLIFLAIQALVDAGDEVIMPDPGFPAYAGAVYFAGGTIVPLKLAAEDGFRVDPDALRDCITPRSKLLVLNSPANPTGTVLSGDELAAIAEVAQAHGLWVLSDETYAQLYYGDPPGSPASLPGMLERTIIVDSFSKTYAMTGWRLGFGVFPEALVRPVTNMIINSHTCVPLFVQDAGIAALTGPQDSVVEMRAAYRARRDRVVAELNAMPGLVCQQPEGAFYAFPRVTAPVAGDVRGFTQALLQAGVAVLPGTDFGAGGEAHFRLSYATALDHLEKGLTRIRTALVG